MGKNIEVMELENRLYQVTAQVQLLADSLHENRDVESHPISLMLTNIVNGCEHGKPSYMMYLFNQEAIEKHERHKAVEKFLIKKEV